MNRKTMCIVLAGKIILLFSFALHFTSQPCHAQWWSFDEKYMQVTSVFGEMSGATSSESYRQIATSGGQPSAIGFSWFGPHLNYGGYLYTLGTTDFTDILPEDIDPFYGNPDFFIEALPREGTVIHPRSPMKGSMQLEGDYSETATFEIWITSMNGFDDPVNLSVCNLCCDLNTHFDPNPVSPPQGGKVSSTLTVSASATTEPGTYSLIVLGIDNTGMLHHTAEVRLHVIEKPDYSLTVAPKPVVVLQRGAVLVRTTVTSLFTFNESVALSVSGLPEGVTGSFFPNPVTPIPGGSITSILTVRSSMVAEVGAYSVTVTGVADDTLIHSDEFELIITESGDSPTVTMSIDPPVVIQKPDSFFTVCLYSDDLSGLYLNTIYGEISFDTTVIWHDSTVNFSSTCLDSMGWDIKWHYKNGVRNAIQFWLIGGGYSSEGIECGGCLLRLGFWVDASATPGNESPIRIRNIYFDEGSWRIVTQDGRAIVNRPPLIQTSLPETLLFREGYYEDCLEIVAVDADNDSIVLWSDLTPDSCDGAYEDIVRGQGSVSMDFCWYPPKHGTCDTLDIDFIAMSTHTTGQPLYDIVSTTIIVQDCEIMVAWPDTAWHAGGWLEIPVRLHADYDFLQNLDVMSMYLELSYHPELMTVFEIGNEGLITEDWGTLTYHHDEENAKIYVAMAGNSPLSPVNPPWEWEDILYVGFWINPDAQEGDCQYLCIDHAKFNEGSPAACTDCGVFTVQRHAITGTVAECSTEVPLDNTLMTLTWDRDLDGAIDSVWTTYTDEEGDYGFFHLYGSTGEYCVTPFKDDIGIQTITSYDASLILRALVGAFALDSCRYSAADVTGDGTVSAYDAAVLLEYVVTGNADPRQAADIGTWRFFPPQICYVSLKKDTTDQDFWGVLVGDVSRNWGSSSPKIIAAGIEAEVGTNSITFTLPEPALGLDFSIHNMGDLQPLGVKIGSALCEWKKVGDEFRIAAASEKPFSQISVAFAELSHTVLNITAVMNEGLMLTTTIQIVPLPTEYVLEQNYPNPFNPTTDIRYQIAESRSSMNTTLKIFNMLGQEVNVLVDEVLEPGYYTVTWDGCDKQGIEMASGVYFYRLQSGDFTAHRRMVLMK
jgi:hypothetical protein